MNYILCIPYVNRPDLLRQAIASVAPMHGHLVVIDNSPGGAPDDLGGGVEVIRPPVPLTFTQTMNYMQRLAEERKADVLMFMHNDGEAVGATAEMFLGLVEAQHATGDCWGVMFTLYDVLCAFNMECVRAVGEWDTGFSQYLADADYYHRVRRAGYTTVDTCGIIGEAGGEVIHHNDASSTKKADVFYAFQVDHFYAAHAAYYRAKWGGFPGAERFALPWNGRFEHAENGSHPINEGVAIATP